MGYDPGGEWCDAVDAGLESNRMVTINDALLRSIRTTGTAEPALELHREEMKRIRVTVAKDPRFTFHPEVLRAWRSVRDDLDVLMTYRNPEHCIASRRRRARFLMDRRSRYPDTVRCQIADSIETLLDLQTRFQLLLFPNFLDQFDRVYDAFQALGLSMDRDRAHHVWADVVDREKVHFSRASHTSVETVGNRLSSHSLFQSLQQFCMRYLRAPDWLRDAPMNQAWESEPAIAEFAPSRSSQLNICGSEHTMQLAGSLEQRNLHHGEETTACRQRDF
jgi:hypothetical protein